MNLDHMLKTFNACQVDYILIGGVNFLLRHEPVTTYDIDLWIDDTAENRGRCERALSELQAEWGPSDGEWRPAAEHPSGWLQRQTLYCMTSPHGAIDVFRAVKGLESWAACRGRACAGRTSAGNPFVALSDEDMLQCQLALPEGERKLDRIRALRKALERDAQ
jgi:hypothetical protein